MGIVLELPVAFAERQAVKDKASMVKKPKITQCAVEVLVQSKAWKKALPEHEALIKQAVEAALKSTTLFNYIFSAECSVMLADDAVIQDLNKQFRAKDKPTNVLSFPSYALNPRALDEVATLAEHPLYLGDIIISHKTAAAEAKEQGKDFAQHVTHLAVHAALHLLGYDHKTREDATLMEPLEIKILSGLGVNNPYRWYKK
jgi:probable rRNA maturation factor